MADEDAYVEALTAPSDLRRAIDERDEARAEADALKADAAQAWKSAAHSVRKIQEQRDEAIRERDEARAAARRQKAQYEEALAARDRAARAAVEDMADWRDEAERYREALERIAAFHHAPGKTYKAAWVESVRIAREALGGGDD